MRKKIHELQETYQIIRYKHVEELILEMFE